MKKTKSAQSSKKRRTTKKVRGGSDNIKCLHEDNDCLVNPNYPEIKFLSESRKDRTRKLELLADSKTPKEFHKIMKNRYPKPSIYMNSPITPDQEEEEEYEEKAHSGYQELTMEEQEFEKDVLYKEPLYKCYKPNQLSKSKRFFKSDISTFTKNALKQLKKINPEAVNYYWYHCSILRHLYSEYHKEVYSKKSRSKRWFSLYGKSKGFAKYIDHYYEENKDILHQISEEYYDLTHKYSNVNTIDNVKFEKFREFANLNKNESFFIGNKSVTMEQIFDYYTKNENDYNRLKILFDNTSHQTKIYDFISKELYVCIKKISKGNMEGPNRFILFLHSKIDRAENIEDKFHWFLIAKYLLHQFCKK